MITCDHDRLDTGLLTNSNRLFCLFTRRVKKSCDTQEDKFIFCIIRCYILRQFFPLPESKCKNPESVFRHPFTRSSNLCPHLFVHINYNIINYGAGAFIKN
ncbi:hypothetical protein BMS3Abin09_00647 [bacterium BMS3Abin09]|nr:hypothetical protein BMS3Abin09_00647 [bacterium BMS3Abin09]